MKTIKFLSLSMVAALVVASCGDSSDGLLGQFTDPSAQFRPVGALNLVNGGSYGAPPEPISLQKDTLRIRESLDRTYGQGFGAVELHPSRNPFFTDEWFDLYRFTAEYSKKNAKQIIMYDDIEYPSGTAGDRIKTLYPEHRVRLLTKTEKEFVGPRTLRSVEMPYEGDCLGTVAFNPETFERVNISANMDGNKLSWTVPEGKWKVLTFSIVQRGRMVDLLSEEAVGVYINLMYEKYYKELGEYFGNVIEKNFFDDIGFWYMINPWNRNVNEEFQKRYGKDPLLYMPALWYDMGEDTFSAREAFFTIVSEKFGDAWGKQLSDWCEDHGLKNMGHVPGAYEPNPTFMHGDPFKFYRFQQVPYIDLLSGYIEGRPGIKITSSVAALNNRPYTGTEIYAAYSYLDGDMFYRVPMEAYVRGISYYVSFANRTGFDGNSYREKNPYTSNEYIREWNDFMGRTASMLQGGRTVSDIALIYPVESLHAWSRYEEDIIEHEKNVPAEAGGPFGRGVSPATAGGAISSANMAGLDFAALRNRTEFSIPEERKEGSGQDVYPSNDYNKISDLLTNQLRREFTFIEADEFISDKISIEGDMLKLNVPDTWQQYRLVIMPSQFIVKTEMLKKLLKYYEEGGRILFTGEIPLKSVEFGLDEEVENLVVSLLGKKSSAEPFTRTNDNGGMIMYVPEVTVETLTGAVNSILPDGDVMIDPVPSLVHPDTGVAVFGVDFYDRGGNLPDEWLGELSYTHKVKDGRDIFFFVNTSNHSVSTSVKLKGDYRLECWNPHTGEVSKWEGVRHTKENGLKYTVIDLVLDPVSSTFAVGK